MAYFMLIFYMKMMFICMELINFLFVLELMNMIFIGNLGINHINSLFIKLFKKIFYYTLKLFDSIIE